MITTGAAAKPIPILRRRSERLFCGVVESVLDTGLLLLLLLVVVVASFSFRSSVRERRFISCRSLVLACTLVRAVRCRNRREEFVLLLVVE